MFELASDLPPHETHFQWKFGRGKPQIGKFLRQDCVTTRIEQANLLSAEAQLQQVRFKV